MSESHTHDDPDWPYPHPKQPDIEDGPLTDYMAMTEAVAELLIDKKVFSADDMRRTLEFFDSHRPAEGGLMVARAWTDAQFKARLLANGTEAVKEFEIDMGDAELMVVEDGPGHHNLIVCTLCSCYPRQVLGLPPDWYKSRNYRSRAVVEPRAVLREFGTEIAENVVIRVLDSTADIRYMVLPLRPAGTEGWDEERLAGIVTRDTLVGVTLARRGATG